MTKGRPYRDRLIKHHLFPQEARLAVWFRANGINIHEWTMLIPEQVHLRVHKGARGGLWNEAWRQYYEANSARSVSREELLSKAFELALRYDIAGPIHSYYAPGNRSPERVV
uniref:SitA6 family polymorphic toxin lipoprotein n=1 Tax=Stigmatella ashevillensis TaxID=2995309 RepID=UPI00358DC04B